MITLTEGIIMVVISSVISMYLTSYKLKKEIHDKYHEKLFDKKFEAYNKICALSGEVVFEVIMHKGKIKMLSLDEFIKKGQGLAELANEYALVYTNSVVDANGKFMNVLLNIESKLKKGEDVLQSDSDAVGEGYNSLINAMRQDLKFETLH